MANRLTAETLANGAISGAFFETFVISEILKSFSTRGIDYRYCVSYYRGRDKSKILKDGTEVEKEKGNGCNRVLMSSAGNAARKYITNPGVVYLKKTPAIQK